MALLMQTLVALYALLGFTTAVIDAGATLLLWQEFGSLHQVLLFMLSMFMAMPIAAVIIGWLNSRLIKQVGLFISFYSAFVISVVILMHAPTFYAYPWVFGALSGVMFSSFWLTISATVTRFFNDEEQAEFHARSGMITIVCYALTPLLIFAVNAVGGSIRYVYAASFFSAAAGLVVLLRLQLPAEEQKSFNMFTVFSRSRVELTTMASLALIAGMRTGVFWAFFSVVIFIVLKSLTSWSIVSFLLSVTASGTILLLKRIHTFRLFEELFLVSGFIYAAVIVFFIANVSPATFLLFAFTNAIYTSVVNVTYSKMLFTVINQDEQYQNRTTEYSVLTEVMQSIGMVIPVVILGPAFIAATDQNNLLLVGLMFIIISYIPHVFFHIIKRSAVLRSALAYDVDQIV